MADFDWRISIADVQTAGPFSTFDGVDRTIVWLEGPAMTLTVAGARSELARYVPFSFDGGVPTSCSIPGGPTRDLNVMTRRGRVHADVEVLRPTVPVPLAGDGVLLLVVLRGSVTVLAGDGTGTSLAVSDALQDDRATDSTVQGDGMVAVIRLGG